jgi:ABC-type multidrug transport system ATPase subunit
MIRFCVLRGVWLKNMALLQRQRVSLLFTCVLSAMLLVGVTVMRTQLSRSERVPSPDNTGSMSLVTGQMLMSPGADFGPGIQLSMGALSPLWVDRASADEFGIAGAGANVSTDSNTTVLDWLQVKMYSQECKVVQPLDECLVHKATNKAAVAAFQRLAPLLNFTGDADGHNPLTNELAANAQQVNASWADVNLLQQFCQLCTCDGCITDRLPKLAVALPPANVSAADNLTFAFEYAHDLPPFYQYGSVEQQCNRQFGRYFEFLRVVNSYVSLKSGNGAEPLLVVPQCATVSPQGSTFPIIEAIFCVIGLSVLLPLFSARVASERSTGVYGQLQVSGGVGVVEYIIANSITDILVYWVVAAVWIGVGAIVKMYIVTVLSVPIVLFIFFLNGIYMILFANAIAFVTTSRATTITVAYLAGLIAPAVSVLLVAFVFVESSPPALNLIPPYAFTRAFILFALAIASPVKRSPAAALAEGYELVGYACGGIIILFVLTALAVYGPVRLARRLLVAVRAKPSDAEGGADTADTDVSLEAASPLTVKDAVLVARSLRKKYGSRLAVANVSLAIGPGEVYGLLGVNGAGKTTLVKMLSGELLPTSGTVMLNGENVHSATASKPRVGVLPQFDTLFEQLTVFEHVLFFSRLKGVPRAREMHAADELIKRVGLQPQRSLFGSTLSGGQKRRLSLAIALCGEPTIVFCDEPSSSLDVAATRNLWRVIDDVKQNHAILLTSHNMLECDVLCDRIGIVHNGRMLCEARPTELKRQVENFVSVSIQSSPVGMVDATDFLISILPAEAQLMSSNSVTHTVIFQAPTGGASGVVLSKLFSKLERGAAAHSILNWSISEPTLEGAFLRVINEDDEARAHDNVGSRLSVEQESK